MVLERGLGGNSSTNATIPGFLMPMPLRRGFGVKRYYKRGVMIFCNGGPSGPAPVSTAQGNIDKIFSWQPWHSEQLDSHNWANAVCDKLELGPVMSCVQARCFKPLSSTDAVVTDMNNYEVGKVMDDLDSKRL